MAVAMLIAVFPARAPSIQVVTEVARGDAPHTVVVTTVTRSHSADYTDHFVMHDDGGVYGRGEALSAAGPVAVDCAGSDCYRVVPGRLGVSHATGRDQPFVAVWGIDGDAYAHLAAHYRELNAPVDLVSTSIVVEAVPGGHVVVVADGRDGVLYRDVTGAWRRLGVPMGGEGCCYFDAPPRLSTDGRPVNIGAFAAPVLGVIVLVVGLVPAGLRRRVSRARCVLVAFVAASGGLVAYRAFNNNGVGMFPPVLVDAVSTVLLLGALLPIAVHVGGFWSTARTPGPHRADV